jgi:thiamine-monophosphate kinase
MTNSQPPTLDDTGEFALIERLKQQHESTDSVLVGIGDDAAVLQQIDGPILVCVDLLVEGRHFRRDWSSAIEIGRRAAAASLADIAAMGGRTVALVVGLAAPGDLPAHWAIECDAGITHEAALVGAHVVGGDISIADQIMLSVTAVGCLDGGQAVLRAGAQAGDIVAVAGRLGHAAAGLNVLSRGFRAPKVAVDAYRIPQPPYALGIAARLAGASAMIDVSDGLIADARHIAEASKVAIDLDRNALPIDPIVIDTASAFTMDPLEWVLTGGDDHALLATFPPTSAVPEGFTTIGVVESTEEPGVLLNGTAIHVRGGHEHFRRE